jgi:hypothetical protein
MSQRIKPTHCYLCGEPLSAPTSVDHVPPQLFFPKEMRQRNNLDRLLTIDTHLACNTSYQKDEEYFVHTLLTITRRSEVGDAHHSRIHKKLKAGKNVALVEMVMQEFKTELKGVLMPPNIVAKLFDHYRMHRIIWKLIRGLYFHRTGEILPPNWGLQYWITAPGSEQPEFFEMYRKERAITFEGEYPDVFAYFAHRIKPVWNVHYWGLVLWDAVLITVMFHDPACECESCQFIGPEPYVPMEGTIKA